jgi:hypothetical protein
MRRGLQLSLLNRAFRYRESLLLSHILGSVDEQRASTLHG